MFSNSLSRLFAAAAICISCHGEFAHATDLNVPVGADVDDFSIPDVNGDLHQLSELNNQQAVAFVFVGVECPIAKLYSQKIGEIAKRYANDVKFVFVNSNHRDSIEEIAQWQPEYASGLLVLRDVAWVAANALGATRNPEVVLLDGDGKIRYRGRIDDQYTTTRRAGDVVRCDIVEAIDEMLHGQTVTVPTTEATGCFIDRGPHRVQLEQDLANQDCDQAQLITYHQHIAPILRRRCVSCHRDGQSAPFELVDYDQVFSWIETIDEVLRERRMPPWLASPDHGKFANDAGLTQQERELLSRWIEADGPEGDPSRAADLEPLAKDEWNIDGPDLILSIPEPMTIPADGVVEYQYVIVDPGFEEDVWVQAAEVRPTNPAVVHHCNVWPQTTIPQRRSFQQDGVEFDWNSAYLAVTAPGRPPMTFPKGMAKRIPAGAKIVFQLHYQPIGIEQTDQTRLGLKFADPGTVRREVATHGLIATDDHLNIAPGDPHHRVALQQTIETDVLLLAMTPHMHQRGKSCRYQVTYPNGESEILLDIPQWKFDWQDRYVLAEPKFLPAGTQLAASAVFDNSAQNPYNPDPTASVHYGPQSTDEMFNAWYESVLANQSASELTSSMQIPERFKYVLIMVGIGCAYLTHSFVFGARRRIGGSIRRDPQTRDPHVHARTIDAQPRSPRV